MVRLPTPVAADKIKATFKNGVLTVMLPKTEEAKQKAISIAVKEVPALARPPGPLLLGVVRPNGWATLRGEPKASAARRPRRGGDRSCQREWRG
jgi:Hsp20/alpha crystallin family